MLVGVAARIWGITWGLPEFYEEGIPFRRAWLFWNWGSSGFNFNPGFFVYPAFTFYFHFLVQVLHYIVGTLLGTYHSLTSFQQSFEANPSSFILLSRIITILFDIGTIFVVYCLGKNVANRTVGIITSLLIALNPLHVLEAHMINVDTPLTFFVVLSLFFIERVYSEPNRRWYILSGIAIGLAAATKYNGALLILGLLIAHSLKSNSFSQIIGNLKKREVWLAIALSGIVFLVFNPYIVLRFNDFSNSFRDVEQHMEAGHLGLDKNTSTISYYLFDSLPSNIGWPMLLVIVASVITFVIRRDRAGILLLAFPVIYIGLISTWAMRADRYIFPVIPILILVGMVGINKFLDFFGIIYGRYRAKGNTGISSRTVTYIIVASILVGLGPTLGMIKYEKSLSLPDTRTTTKQWIVTHLDPTSAIATGPFGIDLSKDSFLNLRIPFNAGETEKTIPFYDTRWYEDLDLVITSDFDYGRYRQEPERFSEILRFYDTLRSKWSLVYQTQSSDETIGPAFWLYKPLNQTSEYFDTAMILKVLSVANPADIDYFFVNLADILSLKGKFIKSDQLLREIARIKPDDSRVHRVYAFVEHRLRHDDNALREVQAYLANNPNDANQIALEGEIFLALNRGDEAEQCYLISLKQDPHIESAYVGLNMIYAHRGDTKSMIDILTRLLSILPKNGTKAQKIQDVISKLK